MQLNLGGILTLLRFPVPFPGTAVKALYGVLLFELQKELTGDVLGMGAG